MKVPVKVIVHLLFASGLLVFITLPSNKYTWMQDMDPSITTLPVDEASGNRAIFTFLLLIAIVSTQLAIFSKAANKSEKMVSLVFVVVAISVWLSRFFQ